MQLKIPGATKKTRHSQIKKNFFLKKDIHIPINYIVETEVLEKKFLETKR